MAQRLGLSTEEYERIKELLKREPNYTELGLFSAMWSEHCSYKNSKKVLKLLPKDVDRVYLSIDLGILDPAYAPGLTYPELGGISTRSLLDFIHGLKELEIGAFDVVGLCPPYDNCSSITALGAIKIILETLGVVRTSS